MREFQWTFIALFSRRLKFLLFCDFHFVIRHKHRSSFILFPFIFDRKTLITTLETILADKKFEEKKLTQGLEKTQKRIEEKFFGKSERSFRDLIEIE